MSRRTRCERPTNCIHLACQAVISTPLFQYRGRRPRTLDLRKVTEHGARRETAMLMLSFGHFLFHFKSCVAGRTRLPQTLFLASQSTKQKRSRNGITSSRPRLSAPPPSIFFTAFIRAYLSRRRRRTLISRRRRRRRRR